MNFNIIKTDKKYYSYRLENDCEYMNYEYKDFFYNDFGKSILGRKIYFIKLGIGKNKKLIISGFNANDHSVSLAIMCFIEKFLQKMKNKEIYIGYNLEDLWNDYSFYFIPMLNPDGIDLCLRDKGVMLDNRYDYIWKPYEDNLDMWRANIRGVDLLYNNKSLWTKTYKYLVDKKKCNPGPCGYPGINECSESEIIYLNKFKNMIKFNKIMYIECGKRVGKIDYKHLINQIENIVLN